MVQTLLHWLDQVGALFRPTADVELCIAYAGHCSLQAPADAVALHWAHMPLARLSVLHGIH